jgi:4-alpha-glucanotransferase
VARIDHFRGFVAYWAVPAGARTARAGTWKRGPGRALFDQLERELDPGRGREPLPLIAEDLGVITPPVRRLRDELRLPGTLVIQFAFDPAEPDSPHRPENHVENRIVYTGTHDHDTARGWYESLDPGTRAAVDAELAAQRIERGRQPWWALIRLALSSPARVAIVQAQDALGLGSEARMNHPARASGNWRWQMRPGALTPALARRMREATRRAGRLPTHAPAGGS